MIYFCADDYGIGESCNERIEDCLKNGILNKISVLPNGMTEGFREKFSGHEAVFSLHLNLVEGYPLSAKEEIPHLLSEDGSFRDSFIGLLLRSLTFERRALQEEIYGEIRKQLAFWKSKMGEGKLSIDSHQHTHMIPMVFRALMRALKDEGIEEYTLRIPSEPLTPYLLSPSLYFSYSVTGLAKQHLLRFFAFINQREMKKAKRKPSFFMGAIFSGHLTEEKIRVLLPRYVKLAEKKGRDVEVALHPGYLKEGESLMGGCRQSFEDFYQSPWRKKEYDTLLNFTYEMKTSERRNEECLTSTEKK